MGKRYQPPSEPPEEELEELPEEIERETPSPPNVREFTRESRPSAQDAAANLAKLLEATTHQHELRIGRLAEAHEQRTSILDKLTARIEAAADIQEDHMASLEEALERMETLAAAFIRMTMSQTNHRETREYPETATRNDRNEPPA